MSSTTSATRRRHAGAAFAAGLVLVVATAAASPAMAASTPKLTTLTFTPPRGLDSTPMYLVVPQPCPAKATNIVALAVGHGFVAGGQPVVTNSTAGISHTAPFVVPLQDSFTGFAAVNGTKLSGAYRISLRCIDALGQFTYASFSGAVTFSDATHYTAPAPPQSLVDAIVAAREPSTGGGIVGEATWRQRQCIYRPVGREGQHRTGREQSRRVDVRQGFWRFAGSLR
jgi:hypothetical protein